MTSQYQYFAFAWRHRLIVVTSQCSVRKGRPWQQWRNERSMIVLSGSVCSWHKIACNLLISFKNTDSQRCIEEKSSGFVVRSFHADAEGLDLLSASTFFRYKDDWICVPYKLEGFKSYHYVDWFPWARHQAIATAMQTHEGTNFPGFILYYKRLTVNVV